MSDSDFPTREILNIARGTSLGRYEILERIGAGGMGEVFLARDSSLKRNVAIKFPPPHLSSNPAYTDRLIREAQAAGGLDHPGIVHIYDVGKHQGRSYLVMEHVAGETLDAALQDGPLSVQAGIRLGRHIAEALDHAHRQGVLHRDIKPANVMIDIHGRSKLVDFGLAFVSDDAPLTQDGSTLGTVGYMAPEIIQGEPATARSDLFSLGVVLYRTLTGTLPFSGDNQAAVMNSVLAGKVTWPVEAEAQIPLELRELIARLLATSPADRPGTGAEVSAVLRSLASESTGPSPVIASKRFPRAILVGLGVVAVAAAAIGYFARSGSDEIVSPAQASIPKLIVFPFENLAGGDRQDPMGEVMSSLIITGLSETRSLSVLSNDYAHQLFKRVTQGSNSKEIAREVDARWLVTGRILQREPTLVVTSELIDPHLGTVMSARKVEGLPGETVFQVVDQLTELLRDDLSLPREEHSGDTRSIADAVTRSPEAYEAFMRGFLLTNDFLFEQAKGLFEEAISLDSTFASAWIGLGACHWGANHLDVADSCVVQAERYMQSLPHKEQLIIRSLAARIRGNHLEMLSLLQELIRLEPGNPYHWVQLGIAHQDLGQMSAAIRAWEKAVAIDADYAPAYNQLAYRYENVGEVDKSLWAINEYIRLSPGKPNPYDSRGDLYARAGELDLAIESYQKALEINPTFFISKLNLALMYAFKNDPAQAEKTLHSLIKETEGKSTKERVEGRYALNLLPTHEGKFQKALENLKAHTEKDLDQDRASRFVGMATIYDYLGRYEDVIRLADQTIPLNPMQTTFFRGLRTRALLRLGRASEAKGWRDSESENSPFRAYVLEGGGLHEEVIELLGSKPKVEWDFFSYFFAGKAYLATRQWDQAVEAFESIAERYSQARFYFARGPLIHYYLGLAYQGSGRGEMAAAEYRTFLDIWREADPGLPDVADARARLEALALTP